MATEAKNKKNIAYVFKYNNMPIQAELVNGSSENMSDLGKVINQYSAAKNLFEEGRVNSAKAVLNQLRNQYDIVESQLSLFTQPNEKAVFRTISGEPVDSPTLMRFTMVSLKNDIGQLERDINGYESRNINKSNTKLPSIIYL